MGAWLSAFFRRCCPCLFGNSEDANYSLVKVSAFYFGIHVLFSRKSLLPSMGVIGRIANTK